MSLAPGDIVTLAIEKPVAGGWMIARHEGRVVLVGGAIPGERVAARVARLRKNVAYAHVVSVEQASPERREPGGDPLCGGSVYSHVAYPAQLSLKASVIADAFARIGGVHLPGPVTVAPSPEHDYRMRARLHVRGGRAGFFREGTHELCDARSTRQLSGATCDVVDRLTAALRSLRLDSVQALEMSENVEGSQRAVHLDLTSPVDSRILLRLAETEGLTGLTVPGGAAPASAPREASVESARLAAGSPYVTDILQIAGASFSLRRHVLSFFQGNRFLVGSLAGHVAAQVESGATVVDLYAGVGLFSVAAAVLRAARVRAIEGDRVAAMDLEVNGAQAEGRVEAVHGAVEAATRHLAAPDVVVADPPRTGMSSAALDSVIALGARKIVYVSCDVATLARDARRLLDAGYALERTDGFDLFPNTPHVETVSVFAYLPSSSVR
jgi:23S rRNA (uracil1939-C5)-methyltransferase